MRILKSQIPEATKKLMAKQGGKCAVCGKPIGKGKDGAVLDHDHTTGFIRGVLHRSCNGIEGKLLSLARRGHSGVSATDFLIGLGKYLELQKKPQTPWIHPSHMTQAEKRAKQRAARAKLKNRKK